MRVDLIGFIETRNILSYIGEIADVRTDRSISNEALAIQCAKHHRWEVFKHVTATWRVEDISLAVGRQLGQYCLVTQKAQRYPQFDTQTQWFVTPKTCPNPARFGGMMHTLMVMYDELIYMGMSPEDTCYILPNATIADLTITMNLQEIFHFYKEYGFNEYAQWEIRELAIMLKKSLTNKYPELEIIFDIVTKGCYDE